MELILVILIVLLFCGGGFSYSRREDWGSAPAGISGILVTILVIVLILRFI